MHRRNKKGLFISFEGIDGCGKSIQSERLFRNLKIMQYPVILIREPGGTTISEKIREILLDRQYKGMAEMTEFFLYEAARAQLVLEKVIPELNEHHIVLTDRFVDSTIAYQAYGRKLSLEMVIEANHNACFGIFPDRSYFLDISLKESKKRMVLSGKADRMEKERTSFFSRVRKGYLEIAVKEPQRVCILDGLKSMVLLEQEIFNDVKMLLESYRILNK